MNPSTVFFSIVVPTRDRVEWLRRCLDGIAEQSFQDFEVVIVDDGSSSEVIASYQAMVAEFGENYRLIRANIQPERRLGPSVIRNIGIQEAEGEYIAFCDDDDYWCSTDLLSVAAASLKAEGADLYFSNQKILHGDEVVAKGTFSNVEKTLRNEQQLKEQPVYRVARKQILCFPDYAHLNITIASRGLLNQIGGFWEDTRYAEDVDLFVRLCSHAEMILFRPTVCSVHNAPIKHDKESASKIVGSLNRRLLEGSVYWHLLATCDTPEAIRYAKLSLGYNSKHLVNELASQATTPALPLLARIAFAVKPGIKWGVYSAILWLKGLLKGS